MIFIRFCIIATCVLFESGCSKQYSRSLQIDSKLNELNFVNSENYLAAEKSSNVAEPNRLDSDDGNLEILSVSGGGHRAAHFAIGAILALDNIGFLKEIDMVSTVSGGSYGVAAYVASYYEAICSKNDQIAESALKLLQKNRYRVYKLGDGWREMLWSRIFGRPMVDSTYRNIDVLEKNYYVPLTNVIGCELDGAIKNELTVKDVTTKTRYLPFIHLVNSANSRTGKLSVFSVKDHDVVDWDYTQSVCVLKDRAWVNLGGVENITYAKAISASAAFPPLISDSIFGLTSGKSKNCNDLSYLRLTDGAQADDNGIIASLKWLDNMRKKRQGRLKKGLIISFDSLIEVSTELDSTIVEDGLIDVALYRNADLPRYQKRRELKKTLSNTNQKKLSEWEWPDKLFSLFGSSIGFSLKGDGERKSGLKFNSEEKSNSLFVSGSNISTFDNSNGLELTQRIAGVAEGFYQTYIKLSGKPNTIIDVVKQKALVSAFSLFCDETEYTLSDVLSRDCRNLIYSDKNESEYLIKIFKEKNGRISIQDEAFDVLVRASSEHEKGYQKSTSLLKFNGAQEEDFKSKLISEKEKSKQNFAIMEKQDIVSKIKSKTNYVEELFNKRDRLKGSYKSTRNDFLETLIAVLERSKIPSTEDREKYRQLLENDLMKNVREIKKNVERLDLIDKKVIDFYNKIIDASFTIKAEAVDDSCVVHFYGDDHGEDESHSSFWATLNIESSKVLCSEDGVEVSISQLNGVLSHHITELGNIPKSPEHLMKLIESINDLSESFRAMKNHRGDVGLLEKVNKLREKISIFEEKEYRMVCDILKSKKETHEILSGSLRAIGVTDGAMYDSGVKTITMTEMSEVWSNSAHCKSVGYYKKSTGDIRKNSQVNADLVDQAVGDLRGLISNLEENVIDGKLKESIRIVMPRLFVENRLDSSLREVLLGIDDASESKDDFNNVVRVRVGEINSGIMTELSDMLMYVPSSVSNFSRCDDGHLKPLSLLIDISLIENQFQKLCKALVSLVDNKTEMANTFKSFIDIFHVEQSLGKHMQIFYISRDFTALSNKLRKLDGCMPDLGSREFFSLNYYKEFVKNDICSCLEKEGGRSTIEIAG